MIYFIQDSETLNIKIGLVAGPWDHDAAKARMRQLQTGCPGKLVLVLSVDGERDREAWFHQTVAHLHVRGEWFRPGPDLLFWLVELAAEEGRQLVPIEAKRALEAAAHPCD